MSLIVPYPTSDFQQGACEFPVNDFPLGRINELILTAYPAVLGLYFSRYKLNGFILEKQQQHPSRYYEDFPGLQQRLLVFPRVFSGGTMRNDATTGFHPRFSPWRSKLEP